MLASILCTSKKFLSTLSLRRATYKIWHLWAIIIFLSTLSLRRATLSLFTGLLVALYFYPRSPCGERRGRCKSWHGMGSISIHALLAESDRFLQSGPMMRQYFYPRSPCGERPRHPAILVNLNDISIHALLAESDADRRNLANNLMAFLSTLSLRRATGRESQH